MTAAMAADGAGGGGARCGGGAQLDVGRVTGAPCSSSSTLVSTIQRFVAIIVSACCVAPTPVPRLVWAGIALAACGCVVYALSEAPQPRKATKMKSG